MPTPAFRPRIVVLAALCCAALAGGLLFTLYQLASMPGNALLSGMFDAPAGGVQEEAGAVGAVGAVGETAAQPWELTGLDGGSVQFADLQARVLFVNRWATWCAPCVREMPTIEALAARLAGEDVAFLLVSDEALETVRPYVEERGWRLPIYVAEGVPAPFASSGIPATFIVDAQRRVALRRIGGVDWDSDDVEEFVRALLSAPDPKT